MTRPAQNFKWISSIEQKLKRISSFFRAKFLDSADATLTTVKSSLKNICVTLQILNLLSFGRIFWCCHMCCWGMNLTHPRDFINTISKWCLMSGLMPNSLCIYNGGKCLAGNQRKIFILVRRSTIQKAPGNLVLMLLTVKAKIFLSTFYLAALMFCMLFIGLNWSTIP